MIQDGLNRIVEVFVVAVLRDVVFDVLLKELVFVWCALVFLLEILRLFLVDCMLALIVYLCEVGHFV